MLTSLSIGLIIEKPVTAQATESPASIESQILNTDDMIVSEPMTFDELVATYSKDANISLEEAYKQVTPNFPEQNSEVSTLAIKQYRTLTQRLTVNSVYKTELKFYCQTSESGNFRGIIKVLSVSMNRQYNNLNKQFGESVYTHLQNANRIFYRVEGDFYNNRTTTFNGGINLSVGKSASFSFGASHSSNHYGYIYQEGRYSF